jgi:hypothetical protein
MDKENVIDTVECYSAMKNKVLSFVGKCMELEIIIFLESGSKMTTITMKIGHKEGYGGLKSVRGKKGRRHGTRR